MKIVLLGYMGVGKTLIGKQLSEVLGCNFIDLDAYIEEKEGKSVFEIFETRGEIYFRKQEHIYLNAILSSEKKIILAVGGGTPCYTGNISSITNENILSFYLQLSPNKLAERLFLEKENRPLIKNILTLEKLTEFIGIHLFERQYFYTQASHTIATHNLPARKVVERIVEYLY